MLFIKNMCNFKIFFLKFITNNREVQDTRYKIIIAHLKEYNCLEIIVYSKPKDLLRKVFVNFQECLDIASKHGMKLQNEQDVKSLLNK